MLGCCPLSLKQAHASCNIIPGATAAFRSELGIIDRPFAGPGDWVKINLDHQCGDSPVFSSNAGDHVVTIVFKPPQGSNTVVLLAEDCAGLARDSCEAAAGGASLACLEASVQETVDLSSNETSLSFRFPNTDTIFPPESDEDGVTLAGPVAIAVTNIVDPLPCGLAEDTCANQIENQVGMLACVDDLFTSIGTCQRTPAPTFSSFTALPFPNTYPASCPDPSLPCSGLQSKLQFTIDKAGNVLIPMDWQEVLLRESVPIPRLVRATIGVEASDGTGIPFVLPGDSFLGSYAPNGRRLPPIFDPLSATPGATILGTVDAPASVLRISRRSASFRECVGGADHGLPCNETADCGPDSQCSRATCRGGPNDGAVCDDDSVCGSGECGPALFDFAARLAEGRGPVVIEAGRCLGGENPGTACNVDATTCLGGDCVELELEALEPVSLDARWRSSTLNAFVIPEAIANADINMDGDQLDHTVVALHSRTGERYEIGSAGEEGRAVARIRESPFNYPAVAVEGPLLAFLESEPAQDASDANGDKDVADTIVRVYERLDGGMAEAAMGLSIAVDAQPIVNDRSIWIANRRVFFRTSEAATALNETIRVSVDSEGREIMGSPQGGLIGPVALSGDGDRVAFASSRAFDPTDDDEVSDVYVRRITEGETVRASVNSLGLGGNGSARTPALSRNGRFVAFVSYATNLGEGPGLPWPGVFRRDLDTGTTVRVSVDPFWQQFDWDSEFPSISADGRFIAFSGTCDRCPLPPDPPCIRPSGHNIYVHDADTDSSPTSIVDPIDPPESECRVNPVISEDGRFIAFEEVYSNRISFGPDYCTNVWFHDRFTGFTSPVSQTQTADLGCANLLGMSADGRFVVMSSLDKRLLDGVVSNSRSIFVYDTATESMSLASVNSDGTPANSSVDEAAISRNGRFVVFSTDATNMVPNDASADNDAMDDLDVFVHDRLTGHTSQASVSFEGVNVNGSSGFGVGISDDGRTVMFDSEAADLVPGDLNNTVDVFIRRPDPDDAAADISSDGSNDDTVLEILDLSIQGSPALRTLCPADIVKVSGDKAAFLRPERAGISLSADCNGPDVSGPDLNGDGDEEDLVVMLWSAGGEVENLKCAGTDIALSDTLLAVLVSERAEGRGDLNGDGDEEDSVVFTRRLPAVAPTTCSPDPSWNNVGAAADSIAVSENLAVFLTSECDQGGEVTDGCPKGGSDLNGDGDAGDRVLQVFDATTSLLDNLAISAQEFVVFGSVVAFRVCESHEGHDLNDDGDTNDCVLHVYNADAAEQRRLIPTRQAATPCTLAACDPRLPYQVLENTVRFLTSECDEGGEVTDGCPSGGSDLNGDGDANDLVLQVFNVARATITDSLTAASGHRLDRNSSRTRTVGHAVFAGSVSTITAISLGICTDTGDACTTDFDCPGGGECFVPPGGCIENLETTCKPLDESPCPADQFCLPDAGSAKMGVCSRVAGPCLTDADCKQNALCNDTLDPVGRLVAPIAVESGTSVVVPGEGYCIESLAKACSARTDCRPGELCGESAMCERRHGVCRTNADCPPDIECRPRLVLATSADLDSDELPDVVDNCPTVSNIDQIDRDADGIGDVCQCGNAVVEAWESCDDGSRIHRIGEACSETCLFVQCADVNDSGSVTASDALAVLQAAVELIDCTQCVCDVDRSGGTTADDARRVLRVVVGLPAELVCPPCPGEFF